MSAVAGPGSFDDGAGRDDADRTGRSAITEASGSMWLLPALLVGVLLFAIAASAHAALYKWVDQHGLVHYSDRLPPDAVDRASTQLNREGIAVKKIGQAPTAAELQARQAAEKQKHALDRERMLTERRDRALLDSYTNESDIDLAKTRALATIEGQITSAQSYIAQIAKRRGELQAKQASYAPGAVPPSIRSELASIDSDLARQAEFVVGKQKEAAAVAARYDADKRRFHDLKSSVADDASPNATRLSAAGASRY
ncbi:MAG: DUF4124 domain-containing protein [Casimicrobiaceae bacterium]